MKIRRLLVILIFALAVFLASIRSGKAVYALLYISVLLPALSALYTLVVYEYIKIHQSIETRNIVKNQPVPYVCRVSNEMRLLSFSQIELKFHHDLSEVTGEGVRQIPTLTAGASDEICTEVICRRRGKYSIGVERILISDVLGLIKPSFKPPVEYPVTVYPRVVQLDSLGLFTFEGNSTTGSSSAYETAMSDTMRDYSAGDDPRLIHWKASARTGTLQVREVSSIERPAMVILVDTRKYGESGETTIIREDNLLEALLAMCNYCLTHGIDVDVYAGKESFFLRSQNDFNELYDWTCNVEFSRLAPAVCMPDRSFTCCALLASGASEGAAEMLISAAGAGAECVLMEFGSGSAVYEAPRFKYLTIPDDCDISQILK